MSLAGGDAVITDIDAEAFARVTDINLRGMVLTCKHVIPIMQKQDGGVIISIGSLASQIDYPYIAYKTSKAGVVAMTRLVPSSARARRTSSLQPSQSEPAMSKGAAEEAAATASSDRKTSRVTTRRGSASRPGRGCGMDELALLEGPRVERMRAVSATLAPEDGFLTRCAP